MFFWSNFFFWSFFLDIAMNSSLHSQQENTREDQQLHQQVDESNPQDTREDQQLRLEVDESNNPQNTRQQEEVDTTKNDLVIPYGYRFHPSAVELVEEYLVNKMTGHVVWDSIEEIDFYQYDPQQLPISEFAALKSWIEGKAYFFTREDPKNAEGSRLIRRPNSNGYWREYREEVPIYNANGVVVGMKRRLIWVDAYDVEDSNWKMTEYRVNPGFIQDLSLTNFENYVVCKVRDMEICRRFSRTDEGTNPIENPTVSRTDEGINPIEDLLNPIEDLLNPIEDLLNRCPCCNAMQ